MKKSPLILAAFIFLLLISFYSVQSCLAPTPILYEGEIVKRKAGKSGKK